MLNRGRTPPRSGPRPQAAEAATADDRFHFDEEKTDVVGPVGTPRKAPTVRWDNTSPDDAPVVSSAAALVAFTTGSSAGAVVRVYPGTSVSFGRSERSSVRIDDNTISRLHARLRWIGSTFSLVDCSSTNGTFVNGARLTGTMRLYNGDSVRLGTRHGFRLLVGDESELMALTAAYESATRDALTGLLNRKMFDRSLDGELAFAFRHGTRLAVLMLDVDHFKNINDSFGHATGDDVLRTIGIRLRESLRAEDIVARLGGEEFAIVVRDLDKDGAQALAERVRDTVSDARVLPKDTALSVGVTVSIGVATLEECGCTATAADLLRLADSRMYKAKRSRNAVVG